MDQSVHRRLLGELVTINNASSGAIKLLLTRPELTELRQEFEELIKLETNELDEVARKFEGIDLRKVVFVRVDGDHLLIFSRREGLSSLHEETIHFQRLNKAMGFFSLFGFVRINKQYSVNIFQTAINEDKQVIIIDRDISLPISGIYFKGVKVAFDHAEVEFDTQKGSFEPEKGDID
jgi:hypothetical protein